jgi:Flp pilus assembly secretin CpaC
MLAKTSILMMLVPSAVLSTYAQSEPNNDQRQMKELFSGSYSDASLKLDLGKTSMLNYGGNVERVALSNADLMTVTAVSPTQFRLEPKAMGSAVLVVWLQSGKRIVYKSDDREASPSRGVIMAARVLQFPTFR